MLQSAQSSSYTFYELICPRIAGIIATIQFAQFQLAYTTDSTPPYSTRDINSQYNNLTKYCRESLPVIAAGTDAKETSKGIARTYTNMVLADSFGIQQFHAPFRAALCSDIYWHITPLHADAALLYDCICRPNNIYCPALADFISNPTDSIKRLSSEDHIDAADAHQLFHDAIHNQTYTAAINKHRIRHEFFIRFDRELKQVQAAIADKLHSPLSPLINKCWISLLTRILTQIPFDVPLANTTGFLIRKSLAPSSTAILATLHSISAEMAPNIKWTVAPWDTTFLNTLATPQPVNDGAISGVFADEVGCAKYLLDTAFKDRIFTCYSDTYYSADGILYNNSRHMAYRMIFAKIAACDLWITHRDDNKPVKDVPAIKRQVDIIMNICPANDEFHRQLYATTLHKLCFRNGYFDFDRRQFLPYNSAIKTSIIIPIDFDPYPDLATIADVFRKVIYPIFSVHMDEAGNPIEDPEYEYMRYQLNFFARRIAGFNEDKLWGIWQGARNSGKSAFVDFLRHTFGDYIGCPSTRSFCNIRIAEDPNKQLGWLIDFQFKRLMICQEQSDDKHGDTTIDGALIKLICSGGDCLSARKLHQNPITFSMQSSVLFCCNNMMDVSPKDAESTLNSIITSTIFTAPDDIIAQSDANKQIFYYYPIDKTIKTEYIRQSHNQIAFMHILINALYWTVYKPAEPTYDPPGDPALDELLNIIAVTKNEADFIPIAELKKIFKNSINTRKLKHYLTQLGATESRVSNERGYKGIRLRK
jgi:hypothetical protein